MHMAPYEHITREKVEEALAKFRGDIMQVPPMWVARDAHVVGLS